MPSTVETSTELLTPPFANRIGAQAGDVERSGGASVDSGGLVAALETATFVERLSQFERGGHLVVSIRLANTSGRSISFSPFDFLLQHPDGRTDRATLSPSVESPFGGLVPGGETTTQLVFSVGERRGEFYILFEPGLGLQLPGEPPPTRGVWGVVIG